jgi:methyltransferase (TIGR00027 family)
MAEKVPPLLAATAAWTASVRALESTRTDALFTDPWAAALAGPAGEAWISQRAPDSVQPIVLRTRFFDDFLLQSIQHSAIQQVVLMAAGLDTRAYRLPWPESTRLFELDQAPVLEHKEMVLVAAGARAMCVRTCLAADLTLPWEQALMKSGFSSHQPSIWLLEGFLFYLPCEVLEQVLKAVSSLSAPGSRLGFDIINRAVLTSPWTQAWVDMQAKSGAPWIGVLDDPESYLAELGWQVSLTQAGQPDAHYKRWTLPVIPTKMPGMPHNWFVTAQKVPHNHGN